MDPTASTRKPIGLLTLKWLPGIGPKTALRIAEKYHTLEEAAVAASEADDQVFTRRSLRHSPLNEAIWEEAYSKACEGLREAQSHGVSVLSVYDDNFPPLLREIADPPVVLYVRGTLKPDRRYVAGVGTREPSEFGTVATRGLVRYLADLGWGIVSGLAFGIDTEAHQAALDVGGYTVAILANGLESVYPKKNEELADYILDAGGALISEQPIGTRAFAKHLVDRDRLQSGMSLATMAFQTDIEGGTMHTVRFALAQSRLLVVPLPTGRHAEEKKSQGIMALATQTGAELAPLIAKTRDYADLLQRKFSRRSPAFVIRSRDDYESLAEELDRRLSGVLPASEDSEIQSNLFGGMDDVAK